MEGRPVGYLQAWLRSWTRVFEKQLQLSGQSGRDLNLWPPDFKSSAPKTWPHYHSPPPLLNKCKKSRCVARNALINFFASFFCFCFCSIADQREIKKRKSLTQENFTVIIFFFYKKMLFTERVHVIYLVHQKHLQEGGKIQHLDLFPVNEEHSWAVLSHVERI